MPVSACVSVCEHMCLCALVCAPVCLCVFYVSVPVCVHSRWLTCNGMSRAGVGARGTLGTGQGGIPQATWEAGCPEEKGTSPSPAWLLCRWPEDGVNALLRPISASQHSPRSPGGVDLNLSLGFSCSTELGLEGSLAWWRGCYILV